MKFEGLFLHFLPQNLNGIGRFTCPVLVLFAHFLLGRDDMLDIVDGQRGHDDEELLQVTLLGVVKLFAKHPDQKLKIVAPL